MSIIGDPLKSARIGPAPDERASDIVAEPVRPEKPETSIELSVVVPVSERYDDVRDVYQAIKTDLEAIGCRYEIIYVLDGDYPDILAALRSLVDAGEPLRVICFARSFGEATALSAGFASASAPLLVTLPPYHQVEPGAIIRIKQALTANDMAVVRRSPRSDSHFNRYQTRLFYRVQKLVTGHEFHDLGCGVRGLRRRVIDEVYLYGDLHRFLPIIARRWGFTVTELALPQSRKEATRRVYRPGVYVRRLLDLFTVFFLSKFIKKPLRFYGLIGSTVAAVGGATCLWLVVERLFFSIGLADRPALLLGSLLVVLGVQIFGLGLIGELIIFTHAKDLKEYTIEKIIN